MDRVSNPTGLVGSAYVYALLFKALHRKSTERRSSGDGQNDLAPPAP